jgi:hypothetical protein
MEILTLIEGQIDDIYAELKVQMKRIAQLQLQMDDVRAEVRRLAET